MLADRRVLATGALVSALVMAAQAQQSSGGADPRVGLRAGIHDAGVAARNMELIANLPKPDGFPALPPAPAAAPSVSSDAAASPSGATGAAGGRGAAPARRTAIDLSFANTDLAFGRDHLFLGNYHGFNIYNVEDARRPRLIASIVCPGGQGDVSIHGNLLFMSVEQTRGRLDCGSGGVQGRVSAERFRGVRIFDVSDLRAPRQVGAVQTCRGSHTHTLIVDPDDKDNVYIYVSGTGSVRAAEELPGCSRLAPEEDPDTSFFSIDVIQVPLGAPDTARIVARPRIFADDTTGAIAGLWKGGAHGPGTQTTSKTDQCHDITAMPEVGLAAGACSGNGILLDISDPVRPVRLDEVTDPNFAYWHSATFNNDGTKVVFTDEWGGGVGARCRASDDRAWGANAIFDIVDRTLQFRSHYKLPAAQTEQENCVAHNGSIVPVPGRDIMVQGWYQGGISVFDFTDSARPVEIAFFDRGPVDAERLVVAGYWSAYWRNGFVFGAEIVRGLDVFSLTPSEHLSRDEIAAAALIELDEFNPQHQPTIAFPHTPVVARAYLDQITRADALEPSRAAALRQLILDLERMATRARRVDSGIASRVEAAARELEEHAANASDATSQRRFSLLAANLKGQLAD